MKNILKINNLLQHPYHQKVYGEVTNESLLKSLTRTGSLPVYPIIVVPMTNPDTPDLYWVVSGMIRLFTLKEMGLTEVEVEIREIYDVTEICNLIVDLNKQRIKTGDVHLGELRHFIEMYPGQPGIKGNRYSTIGKEIGRSKDSTKNLVMLEDFFRGEGDCILVSIFGGQLTMKQGFLLKKVVEHYPEKFDSGDVFIKFCDKRYDFNRLEHCLNHLDPRDELEFGIIKEYLLKNMTIQDLQNRLKQLGKVTDRVQKHNDSKVNIPDVDENYISKHVKLINGDNRTVEFINPFERPVNCIVGSPPYGNLRLNGDDPDSETGHDMTGKEYGIYLSETYSRYKEYMDPSGSIYVIIDDYRKDDGSLSLSLEHFVVEMERKGFYLVGRYVWSKTNPQPRSYDVKSMVGGFEMIYRFSVNPEMCYYNPDLFLELDTIEKKITQGCTNTNNKGKTTRGNSYIQSHLKKTRNTLDLKTCIDVIRGNVSRPEDFFRQVDEKRHTSTSPIYLTSVLILESTKPGDLVVDIFGGVGNTMTSSLLLGRDYIGVEKEEGYYKQSQRRLMMTESWFTGIQDVEDQNLLDAA